MEALIKALGQIPKWFTNLALLMVLIMLGVLTYSVTRTIIFDCGKVEIAGTGGFGGHCQNFTTSEWRHVAVPEQPVSGDTPLFPDEYPRQTFCRETVYKTADSIDGIFNSGETQVPFTESDSSNIAIIWYQSKQGTERVDILMQCLPDALLLIATGPADDKQTVRLIADKVESAFADALKSKD
jgi:hypothetical protein